MLFWIWLFINVICAPFIIKDAYSIDDSCACLIVPVWRMRLEMAMTKWLSIILLTLMILLFLPFLALYFLWFVINVFIAIIICSR